MSHRGHEGYKGRKGYRLSAALIAAAVFCAGAAEHSRRISFADLTPSIQRRLASRGIGAGDFAGFVSRVDAETERRVAEGEREHLVHYALQSMRFTSRPPIEPAVSAIRFVERLSETERDRLIADAAYLPRIGWPEGEARRMRDLLDAIDRGVHDARVDYFRQLLAGGRVRRVDDLYGDYVRVARFLYMKESGAARSPGEAGRIAGLYRERAHSSDTQVEAGFGVHLALGIVRGLEPQSGPRLNHVLIVGPGMDLAPRTDLIDLVAPQSYQPFAVADALLALSLASERDLRIHSVDVNPRVVAWLDGASRGPVALHFFTGVAGGRARPFSDDFHAYADRLGLAIGDRIDAQRTIASDARYLRSIAVRPTVARALTAERLNIVTGRLLDDAGYDAIVATNVLAYFSDDELQLALSNVAAMLRPGGYFIHNESRAGLAEMASDAGLPIVQMRTAIIAGPATHPLYDAVWLHAKPRT